MSLKSRKDLYWISTLGSSSKLRSSWFTNKILPHLTKNNNVILFTPERLNLVDCSYYRSLGVDVNNILKLPLLFGDTDISDFQSPNLIYSFDDNPLINVSRDLIQAYPGVGIFHDVTMFRAEIAKFSHCTGPSELNKHLKTFYLDTDIDLGSEQVLDRPLAIYADFFDFLTTFSNHLNGAITFGTNFGYYLKKYFENILSLESENYTRIKKSTSSYPSSEVTVDSREIHSESFCIIVIAENGLSRAYTDFQHILINFHNTEVTNKIDRIYLIKGKNDTIDFISLIDSYDDAQSLILNNNVNGLIDLNGTCLHCPHVLISTGLEAGIRCAIESYPELSRILSSEIIIFEKFDSFDSIVHKLVNQQSEIKDTFSYELENIASAIVNFAEARNKNLLPNGITMFASRLEERKIKVKNILFEREKKQLDSLISLSEELFQDNISQESKVFEELFGE